MRSPAGAVHGRSRVDVGDIDDALHISPSAPRKPPAFAYVTDTKNQLNIMSNFSSLRVRPGRTAARPQIQAQASRRLFVLAGSARSSKRQRKLVRFTTADDTSRSVDPSASVDASTSVDTCAPVDASAPVDVSAPVDASAWVSGHSLSPPRPVSVSLVSRKNARPPRPCAANEAAHRRARRPSARPPPRRSPSPRRAPPARSVGRGCLGARGSRQRARARATGSTRRPAGCWDWSSAGRWRRRRGRFVNGRPGELRRRVEGGRACLPANVPPLSRAPAPLARAGR